MSACRDSSQLAVVAVATAAVAVAVGSKLVEGHAARGEPRTAVKSSLAAIGGVSTNPDASPEVLAAMETLAATASPNKG